MATTSAPDVMAQIITGMTGAGPYSGITPALSPQPTFQQSIPSDFSVDNNTLFWVSVEKGGRVGGQRSVMPGSTGNAQTGSTAAIYSRSESLLLRGKAQATRAGTTEGDAVTARDQAYGMARALEIYLRSNPTCAGKAKLCEIENLTFTQGLNSQGKRVATVAFDVRVWNLI